MNPEVRRVTPWPGVRLSERTWWLARVVPWILAWVGGISIGANAGPLGEVGRQLRFERASSAGPKPMDVRGFAVSFGEVERRGDREFQWLRVDAEKSNGTRFTTWWLANGVVSESRTKAGEQVARYLLQEGAGPVVEYRDGETGGAVLPSVAAWPDLVPRFTGDAGEKARFLGHEFRQVEAKSRAFPVPTAERTVNLRPGLMIGLPSNTRQKDERRRYDGSDYELVPLEERDYREMVDAGMNCVRVDARQLPWVEKLDTYYWGVGPADLPFPECLFRSAYLGPALFLDEPAVGTRDHVLRPRFAKEPAFRKAITPRIAWQAFEEHFDEACRNGAATVLGRGISARGDVDAGTMDLRQANLYSWETMADTAAYQLAHDPLVPAAIVFEPPGRLGTWRTVPEWNMSHGCQLPVEDRGHLTSVVFGFLRGAARLTGKEWGTSIYGAVDRADAPFMLTTAYDQGATRFYFWDNYQLACVPFGEALGLARHLKQHASNRPARDLARLREAAEVLIVMPRGYGLGHVSMGKGLLWGLPELNLERTNAAGATYRTVMSRVFAEVERCRRLGVAFDLVVDLPDLRTKGYHEVVTVREDGTVEVARRGLKTVISAESRRVARPDGEPPGLEIQVRRTGKGAAGRLEVHATVTETSAPIFYTAGADATGVNRNVRVFAELHGPGEEDYRTLIASSDRIEVRRLEDRVSEVVIPLRVEKPGNYRLRAATCDLAGRTTVVWRDVVVESER